MQCPQCQARSDPGKRFCGDCGAPLAQVCPACGVQGPPGKKFCGDCGASFAAAPKPAAPTPPAVARPMAERRYMTIVFCDLAGSTPLAARLELEDVREVIAGYHKVVASLIAEAGGFLARYVGDGVLAYFGYPRSREEDPERAVRAGLLVADAVGRMVTLAGPAGVLQARVGIASGLVVVGDMADTGAGEAHAVVGETPNLAARLQGIAAPGKVVIDAATRRLIGGLFVSETLGALTLKGLDKPIEAWCVQAENKGRSRFEALRTGSSGTLIGREEELEFLLRRWGRTLGGDGCGVLVSGEGGLGKSRLVDAFEAGLGGDVTRLHCYCAPHHQLSSYHPMIAFLEQAAGFDAGDRAGARLGKLLELVGRVGLSGNAVGALADLLSIAGDRPQLSAPRRKEQTLEALIGYVEAVARHGPTLLLVEDAHWLDPSTGEFLDMVVDRLVTLPLLLVVTSRPEFEPPWLSHPGMSLLALRRLDRGQAAEIVADMAASTGLSPGVCERIISGADGVPLYIEELTKAVLESQRAMPGRDADRLLVPSSLQASLMARLDRQPAAKEVAQVGSVIGRSFAETLLLSVAQLPDALVQQGFEELIASRIASRRGESPNATYTFKHALVQDAAYESMLRDRRVALHERVAELLGQREPGLTEVSPELLGHHYAEARRTEEAARHFLRAAQRSVERSALPEARAHLARGTSLAGELPPGPIRYRLETEAHLLLGNVQMSLSGFGSPEHGEAFAQAAMSCRRLERTDPSHLRFTLRALYGDWTCKLHRGDLAAALPVAEELRQFGLEQVDPETRMTCETTYGFTRLLSGHVNEAGPIYAAALLLAAEPATGTSIANFGFDALALLQGQASRALACMGHAEQAEQQAQQALATARRANHQATLAITLAVCATTAWLLNDVEATASRSAALLALAAEHSFAFWLARGNGYAGWAASAGGAAERGAAMVREGLELLQGAGISLYTPGMLAMLADACLAAGRPEAASDAIKAGLSQAYRTGEIWLAAELHRRRADMLLHASAGRDDGVIEPELLRAIALARRQGANLFELRAATSLAKLWQAQGRTVEARQVLEPIHGWFSQDREQVDVERASLLLQQLTPATSKNEASLHTPLLGS